jgi:colanic acid biosynthesis glycosyl transferase WcaI
MHPQSKRILIVNRTFPPSFGATGRVACDLALYLRSKGHKVTVLTTAPKAKTDKAKNLTVIRLPAPQHPKGIWGYLKINKAMQVRAKKLPAHDIVISMTDPPLQILSAGKIAKRMKAKHIHWVMDLYPDLLPVLGKDIPRFLFNHFQRKMHKAMKKADVIVPISKCMARYLTHHGLPKNKMTVIENWPDKYLLDDKASQESLFDDAKFRILYAGTIGLAHEFDTVITAAIYFQKTDSGIEFVFTGRGRGLSDFQSKIKNNNLKNIKIISPQRVQNLPQLMETGDVHLVTMKPKALGKLFPSKFYSACATARPVIFIGPLSCDICQKIIDFNCGATIKNGEGQLLVNAIKGYKTNPDKWYTASQGAKAVLNNHNPLDQWHDLINS